MKILLFGADGLVGTALRQVLSTRHRVIPISHAQCDISRSADVLHAISDCSPEAVINAAGYTNVDLAEMHAAEAFLCNEQGVKNIVEAVKKKDIPLIHFSTDYVFDGSKKEGYLEDDSPAPLSLYGKSKAAGEAAVLSGLKKFYLIRSAWLYGKGGKNFVDTMLSLAQKNETLRVVADQLGSPTYSLDLAQAILRLLEGAHYGMYHLVNTGSCSWYEFAQKIFTILGVPVQITPITTRELGRPAPRPSNSILINTKAAQLRPWQEALADYLQDKTFIL